MMKKNMAIPTDITIQHAIKGRMRIRVPWLTGRKDRMQLLEKALSGTDGIKRVRPNHLCGTITIHYDSHITESQSIIAMITNLTSIEIPVSSHQVKRPQDHFPATQAPGGIGEHNKPFRKLWNLAGITSVGIGIAGIFVPLVPTVPLFLLAGFCFWRGSRKFYNRLVNSGTFGRMIDDFRKGRGMTARGKLRAILFMWVSLTISALCLVSSFTPRIMMLLVGLGVTYHILRIKTFVPQINKERCRLAAPE